MAGLLSPMLLGPAQRMQMPGGPMNQFPAAPTQQGQGGILGFLSNIFQPTTNEQFGELQSQRPGEARGRFAKFLEPDVALPVAAALLGGQGNRQNFANALGALGPALKENQTEKAMRQLGPVYAELLDMGIEPGEVFNLYVADRKAQKPNYMSVGDGYVFDENTREFIASPAAGSKEKLDQFGLPRSGSISQKAQALRAQGFDEQTALGIASGRYNVSVNPVNGERVLIDVANQQIVPLKQPDTGAQQTLQAGQSASSQGKTLYDMVEQGTGVGSSLKTGASNTLGQIPGPLGDMLTFEPELEAQQAFRLFQRDLIRSLSLNPRFPVEEQKRIAALVPSGPLTSPEALRVNLEQLDQELARVEQQAMAGMNDPSSPVDQRQADIATLRGVRAARARLGIPQDSGPAPMGGNMPERDAGGWTTLPNGVRIREKAR